MADMILDAPVAIVPPSKAVTIDRLIINRLWIEYQDGKWPARLNLSYFGRDDQGQKVFARNADGSRVAEELAVEDIFATGNNDLDAGIASIMRGLLELYLASKSQG
jgi:hypothetical protein